MKSFEFAEVFVRVRSSSANRVLLGEIRARRLPQ